MYLAPAAWDVNGDNLTDVVFGTFTGQIRPDEGQHRGSAGRVDDVATGGSERTCGGEELRHLVDKVLLVRHRVRWDVA